MQQKRESRLKKAGLGVLGLLMMVGVLLLGVLLLRGMVWASEKALPWLITGSQIALGVCVFVLLPLCIFRKTRPAAGVGFYFASYVFGALLFAFSCLVCVSIWGYGALVVGLILAGIGVVPVALAATLFTAHWWLLLDLIGGLLLTFGTRVLGTLLATHTARQSEEEPFAGEEVTEEQNDL